MKRAVLMALGIGAVLTSAAAFSTVASGPALAQSDGGSLAPAHMERRAREAQRAGIEARYQELRASCATLGGARRDQCLIDAHTYRGRSMLAAAAPYETRF